MQIFYAFYRFMEKKKKPSKQAPYKIRFFREFINSTGVPIKQIAEGLGSSTSAILYWFICDDVRLSKIIEVSRYLGYSVLVGFVPKVGMEGQEDPMKNVFNMDDVEKLLLKPTHFLAIALKDCGITMSDLARKLNISREAVSYWFGKGDINMNNILRCAQVLGKDVCIRFVKRDDMIGEPNTEGAVRIRSNVERSGEWVVVPNAQTSGRGAKKKEA